MASTPEGIVAPSTTKNIEPSWLSRELDEQEGRRRAWERGLKEGGLRVLQSQTMETLAFELTMLRNLVAAMTEAAIAQEKTIAWYQAKVQELAHHILTRPRDV